MIELKYNFLNFIALLAVLVQFKGNPFSHSKIHLIFDFVNIHTKFFSCQKKKAIWKQKIFREFVHGPISSSSLNFLLFCEEQNSLIYFKYYVNLVSFSANKRSWRQTWKCEAFATGQTAQHLINLTKLQSFLTWSLYFPICSVFLGRHDTNEWMTCSLVGKLFLFISAYKAAVSTLLVLTFSIFEVGSILDFVHSGFFPFGILSNSGFCPIRDFVQFGILSILDIVQFWILSNSRFCPFRILSNSGFCPFRILSNSGFCPIRDFVQFGILPILDFVNSGFCPFWILFYLRFCPIRDFVHSGFSPIRDFVHSGICSIRDFVHSGFCPIRDFIQFGILPILDFVHSGFCFIWDFVHSGFCPIRDFVLFKIFFNSGICPFWILSNSGFCPIRDTVFLLHLLFQNIKWARALQRFTFVLLFPMFPTCQ